MPAPAFTNLTSGGNLTAGTTRTTASVTPSANQLVLISIHAYITTGSIEPPAPTVGGNGIGYELIREQQVDTAGTDRATLFVYRGMSAAPSAGTILIDFGAVTINNCAWSVDQSDTNVPAGSNGAKAIVASAGSKSASTVTTQPTSFPQTMATGNSGFFACGTQVIEAQTPRASWTELGDFNTVSVCTVETQYIAGTDTAGSSTWTTAARAGSIVIEVSPLDNGQTITAVVDSPDTYLPDATLLSPADDDGGGDPALGYLYQPWPTQILGAAISAVTGDAATAVTAALTATGVAASTGDAASTITANRTATGATGVSTGAATTVTATLTASGIAAAVGNAATTITASLTASGTVATSTGAATTITVGLTASGTGNTASGATTTVTATLTATGTVSSGLVGNAATTVTATLTTTGTVGRFGAAATTVTAQLAATGSASRTGAAALVVTVGLTAAGTSTGIIVPLTVTGTDRPTATVTSSDTGSGVTGTDRALASVSGSDRSSTTVSGADRPTSTIT